MPSSETILFTQQGGIARLLLNKPGRMNALDPQMLETIEISLAEWEKRGDVVVLVVGSTHERSFCAGADLAVLAAMDERRMQDWEMLGNRVLDRLQNSPLISIAAISGPALGGGLTLAAACDFRIAGDNASFAQPEIELGWMPGWGGVARLARLVGACRAKELSMTGRRIDSSLALAMGLINEAVPAADLDSRVTEFASALEGRSPAALRTIKALADASFPLPPAVSHRLDALANASFLHDPRGQAAIARFLSRRSGKGSA
jgi:enoyl-CoA hydratase/carnithine racemase